MDRVELSDVWAHIDLKTLFRLHWGGKGSRTRRGRELQRDEFLPRLARMQREAVERQWLQPRVRYGYFPANRDGNDLVIFSPDEAEREIARFTFPANHAAIDSVSRTTISRCRQDGETSRSSRSQPSAPRRRR